MPFACFGTALVSGDFNGDGFDDLAIGAPNESVGGAVHVLYGSSSGLRAAGDQFWTQVSAGVLDTAEDGDGFGWSLAAGDFDGDGRDDLAIAIMGEDVNGLNQSGAVAVLRGTRNGPSVVGDQVWTQNSAGIQDKAEPWDCFGTLMVPIHE